MSNDLQHMFNEAQIHTQLSFKINVVTSMATLPDVSGSLPDTGQISWFLVWATKYSRYKRKHSVYVLVMYLGQFLAFSGYNFGLFYVL